jgi:hypothetical protein
VIKQPLDYAVLVWAAFDLIAFGYMVVGFGRLFAQAWKMPNRWPAIWKVVNIKPRGNHEWPNSSPEAELILRGAALAAILFSVALVSFFVVIGRSRG